MGFELNYIAYIGFLAQGLFFLRFAVQLVLSEKAKASLSPTVFWWLSLISCYIMMSYGFLRDDISIIEGQLLTYFIYIRNLQLKGAWEKLPFPLRILLFFLPFLALLFCLFHFEDILTPFFKNPNIPLFWLVWGVIGQSLFSSRFIYQWLYSEHKKESQFPLGFWTLSILGAGLITIYAIFTGDLVQFVGKGTGLLMYTRNFYLRKMQKQ